MRRTFKNKAVKCLAALLGVVIGVSSLSMNVKAESYSYSIWDEAIPSPDAYEWSESVRGEDMGTENFSGITDLFQKDGTLYISMAGRIVVLTEDFRLKFEIREFKTDVGTDAITTPTSVYVDVVGDIYVAEEAKGVIYHFDGDGNWKRTLKDPEVTGLEKVAYQPTKIVVDENGRIYVKAKSVYEGIIELDPDGKYTRYVGANKVNPNFIEILQRKFATEEQKKRMKLWLPTDYSDIAIDADGFLMATVADAQSTKPIRRLNSTGNDIMPEYDSLTTAMGDYKAGVSKSNLVSIATNEDGRFAVMDSLRKRIFVYAQDGLLLYTFGGSGTVQGTLNSPIDICFMGDKFLIADYVTNSIEVFDQSVFGGLIDSALEAQGEYDYETAAYYWAQVREINPNTIAANMGLGKQALRAGEYEDAMMYFEACLDRESYSSAYERVREAWLNENLFPVVLIVLAVVVALMILKRVLRKYTQTEAYQNHPVVKVMKKVRYEAFTYPGYVLAHPFKAFDEIKYENAGSVSFSLIVLVLFAWANLIKVKYAGFLVNYENTDKINVPLILISCLLPYVIWIIGSWAIGTLIDGKANMKQVLKFTAYAMYPSVFCYVAGSVVSQFIIYDEAMLVQFLFIFPMVMFFMYCFIGVIMCHQYTFSKGLFSVLLSLVAMVLILFVVVLLATLVSGVINDVMTIWDEFALYYL